MTLLDSRSKLNAMTPVYAAKLGLRPWPTNVDAQKIDDLALTTHGMASASFSLQDSQGKVWFFKKTFLLANISMQIVLAIFFLALSNVNIEFTELEKLIWRFYIAAETLPITS